MRPDSHCRFADTACWLGVNQSRPTCTALEAQHTYQSGTIRLRDSEPSIAWGRYPHSPAFGLNGSSLSHSRRRRPTRLEAASTGWWRAATATCMWERARVSREGSRTRIALKVTPFYMASCYDSARVELQSAAGVQGRTASSVGIGSWHIIDRCEGASTRIVCR